MHIFKLLLGVLILIFLFTFSTKNMTTVQLHFYNWSSDAVPIFLVIVASLLAGAIIAWLFEILERIRQHQVIRKQRKTIAGLEANLEQERVRLAASVPEVPTETSVSTIENDDKNEPSSMSEAKPD